MAFKKNSHTPLALACGVSLLAFISSVYNNSYMRGPQHSVRASATVSGVAPTRRRRLSLLQSIIQRCTLQCHLRQHTIPVLQLTIPYA